MATATVSGLTLIEDMETAPTITNIGGGPGAGTTNDVIKEGAQAIGRRVGTTGAIRGFGVDFTAVDFTVSGRLLWVWWNAALGADLSDTQANGGYRIRVSSTAGGGSNYAEFYVGGSDVTVTGNWNRTILDINNLTANVTNGTPNFAAIINVTISYLYPTSTPGGNIPHVVMDAIHYGDTITVTGGTSGDPLTWEDVSIATEVSAWGVLEQPPGSSFYRANGNIQFGTNSGATNCFFKDSEQIIEWQDQQYYLAPALSSSVPATLQGITIVEDTGTTVFQDGNKIGTGDDATGGGGSIFQVPPGSSTPLHFVASDAQVTSMSLYGTQIRRAQDRLELSADATNGPNHEVAGVAFVNCGQAEVGRVVIRNSSFESYSGPSGSLLWNPDINVKFCAFRGASSSLYNSAGIHHDTTGSFSYQGLTFEGNEFDILNSSTGRVDITASLGANPTTTTSSNGGSVGILNAVQHTVTDLETGSRVVWIRVSDDVELANEVEVSGEASYTYNYTGDVDVDVQILSLNFRNKIVRVTLSDTDATLPASQTSDRTYFNPT